MDRLDRILLKYVYQPTADWVWRYTGKNRFFVAWICFGVSFVSSCLDVYAALMRGASPYLAALLGGPFLLVLLTYLSEASDRISPQSRSRSTSNQPLDQFDRFIRRITISSALGFTLLSAVCYLATGSLAIVKHDFLCIIYSFGCASALYLLEVKPPAPDARLRTNLRFSVYRV